MIMGNIFSNTSPFYDEKWSPFNLGIYMDRQDDKPKASKYIGVMPALDRNADQTEMFWRRIACYQNCLKILCRFTIENVEKSVWLSNDYYEKPDMIK